MGVLGESVRLNTLFARSLRADIIELRQEFALAYLSTGKLLCGHKVLEVTVVCKYSNQESGSLKLSIL